MANQVKKILVPLDGSKNSERGLDKAIFFARQCGATITGISVLDHTPVSGLHNVGAWRKNWLKTAKTRLSKAKKHAAQCGVDLKEKISYGYAGDQIVNYAQKNKIDLIVIGHRGKSALKEAFFGSVSNHVIHKAKMPIVIVK